MAVNWVADEAALLPQAFDEVKDAQSSATNIYVPSIKLGTVAQFHDAGSTEYGTALFKYVRYTGGSGNIAGVSGLAVYHSSADDNYLVTMDCTDGKGAAGILHSAPGGASNDDDYIWIQIAGIAAYTDSANLVAGSGSVLDQIVSPVTTTAGSDGKLQIRVDGTAATVVRRPVASVTGANTFLLLDFPR
tara:strand:- start:243 stop:809 length:567 start_codon:yes stop_codon:yes gene_type:complete